METLIIVIHVIAATAIVGLVLLQQGKGADAGASFGAGASQTVFGASGSGNFLVRATTIAATIFFITSLSLAIFARDQAGVGSTTGLPVLNQNILNQAPAAGGAASDLPAIEQPVPDTGTTNDVPSLPGTDN